MVQPATNSVRSLATESYNVAARLFVNRDFAGCYGELRPLLDRADTLFRSQQISKQTLTKMFVLYATLCDAAFQRSEEQGLSAKDRRSLQQQVLEGTLWQQAALAFGAPGSIPPGLILSFINVTAKHSGDAKVAQEFVENYMTLVSSEEMTEAERSVYKQVVEAFAKQVLVANGEFQYAQEVVNSSMLFSTGQRLKLVAELEVAERKYKEDQARREAEQREQAKQEAARVAKAIEEERAAAEAAKATEQAAKAASPERTATPEARRQVVPRPRQSLPAYWRDMFTQYFRRHGLMNALLLLLLLISASTNRQARDRIAGGSRWVWAALRQSAAMVFTVTYL